MRLEEIGRPRRSRAVLTGHAIARVLTRRRTRAAGPVCRVRVRAARSARCRRRRDGYLVRDRRREEEQTNQNLHWIRKISF